MEVLISDSAADKEHLVDQADQEEPTEKAFRTFGRKSRISSRKGTVVAREAHRKLIKR